MTSQVSYRVPPGLAAGSARAEAASMAARPPESPGQPGASSLHVSKLRGIGVEARSRLKRQGITYTDQLLERAGTATERRRLAARTGIAEAELLRLARRADLARIKGVGAIFADMLELVGINDVAALAGCDPTALHARLYALNADLRFARRAPTPDEVAVWIRQARTSATLLDGSGF